MSTYIGRFGEETHTSMDSTPEQSCDTPTDQTTGIKAFFRNGRTICTFSTSERNGRTVDVIGETQVASYEILQTENPLKEILVVTLCACRADKRQTKRYFLIYWDSNRIEEYELFNIEAPIERRQNHLSPIRRCVEKAIIALLEKLRSNSPRSTKSPQSASLPSNRNTNPPAPHTP
jgi:hypothetical protein